MEEAKQICMETSLRAEQTLATATAHVHVDMRAWETSERVQQQRRKVLADMEIRGQPVRVVVSLGGGSRGGACWRTDRLHERYEPDASRTRRV